MSQFVYYIDSPNTNIRADDRLLVNNFKTNIDVVEIKNIVVLNDAHIGIEYTDGDREAYDLKKNSIVVCKDAATINKLDSFIDSMKHNTKIESIGIKTTTDKDGYLRVLHDNMFVPVENVIVKEGMTVKKIDDDTIEVHGDNIKHYSYEDRQYVEKKTFETTPKNVSFNLNKDAEDLKNRLSTTFY